MATWNSAFQDGSQVSNGTLISDVDDKVNETRVAVQARLVHEHVWDLASGSSSVQGWHKNGSAIAYYGTSAPTYRPDGATPLDSGDAGRPWVDTSNSLWQLKVYTGSAWQKTGLKLSADGTVVLESVTSDPVAPVAGQLWFRSDV